MRKVRIESREGGEKVRKVRIESGEGGEKERYGETR